MSFHIRCPQGHVLAVDPAHVGKKVQCPACQVIMVVPPPPDPAPPVARAEVVSSPRSARSRRQEEDDWEPPGEDDYEEDAPRRSSKRVMMSRVRTGLGFHKAKIITIVVGIILIFLLIFFGGMIAGNQGAGGRGAGAANTLGMLAVGIGLLVRIVSLALGITGSYYCLSIPSESGAKELIMVSFGLDIICLPLALINDLAFKDNSVFSIVVMVLIFVSFILFFVFLKRVARYLRRRSLESRATNLLIQAIVVPIAAVLVFIIFTAMGLAAGGMNPNAGLGIVCIGGLAILALAVWAIFWLILYIRLLDAMQNEIRA